MLLRVLKKGLFFSCWNKMLPSGFEPESKPREGFMIGRYTTGAEFFFFIFFIHRMPLEVSVNSVHPQEYHPKELVLILALR
jgi:hypothetical protein